MASCRQIDNLLQAYIDGELSDSERVILEEHVANCAPCRQLLRLHQRTSAELFETLSHYRLSSDLSQSIMENLPEMAPTMEELKGINWRVKHSMSPATRLARWMPAAVAGLLVVLALILKLNWPEFSMGRQAVGVITYTKGDAFAITDAGERPQDAELKGVVRPGDHYETRSDSSLMVTLAGPSEVKLNRDTQIRVDNERELSVQKGEVWLNVGSNGAPFRVFTPDGQVLVFGTAFGVKVDSGKTVVTVESGEVQVAVENHTGFRRLEKGQQIQVVAGKEPPMPKYVLDAASEMIWTKYIVPDSEAKALFEREIQLQVRPKQFRGRDDFMVINDEEVAIRAIRMTWKPHAFGTDLCAYDIYVYDPLMRPLFSARLTANILGAAGRNSYDIEVPEHPISGVSLFYVRAVPVFSTGTVETEFQQIYAQPVMG